MISDETFQFLGIHHIGALIAIILLGSSLIWFEQKSRTYRHKKTWAYLLAWLNIASLVIALISAIITRPDDNWVTWLPLHFCSFMQILCVLSIFTNKAWIRAACFYGVLTASLQGLITPDLRAVFPSLRYIDFFMSHGLTVITAFYLPLALQWRPRKYDYLLAQGIGVIYLLFSLIINVFLGTNYGFTMQAPASGSILDYLGPWPWYILTMQIPIFIALKLLSLIFIKSKPRLGITFNH